MGVRKPDTAAVAYLSTAETNIDKTAKLSIIIFLRFLEHNMDPCELQQNL